MQGHQIALRPNPDWHPESAYSSIGMLQSWAVQEYSMAGEGLGIEAKSHNHIHPTPTVQMVPKAADVKGNHAVLERKCPPIQTSLKRELI